MSGTKKLRRKLGRKVIAGKMTVTEARARLGRQIAQDSQPGRKERVYQGLEAAAAAIKSARPVTYQDVLDAARPMTRPMVTKAAPPVRREDPRQVLKALKSWQPAEAAGPVRPVRSRTPVELAMLREVEKISDPVARENTRTSLMAQMERNVT